jgi:hypothetical protein
VRQHPGAFPDTPDSSSVTSSAPSDRSGRMSSHMTTETGETTHGWIQVPTGPVGGYLCGPICVSFSCWGDRGVHGLMWMIVFPLCRSVELRVATALSRDAIVPMLVRSRPSRTR